MKTPKQLDLDVLRAAARGNGTDEVPVTKRCLRKIIREIEEGRDTFRSPIIDLTHGRGGAPA